jgi:diguanylate cyclase (GGDEF)-like protein/PAS domain S-box-containing protein
MKNTWLYSEHSFFVFRNIIEQVADHVMVTDKHGFIEYVNPSFEKTTGYSKEEVLGKNPRFLNSGEQSLEFYHDLWKTILSGKVFYSRIVNKKKNGEIYVADQTVSPIINQCNEISHFVSIWKDVTAAVRIEERLEFEKEKLEEIIGFDEQLTRIRKSDLLIDFVVAKTVKILEVKKCSVMLVDGDTKQLYTKSMEGFAQDVPMEIAVGGSIAERAIMESEPVLVNDLESDLRFKNLKNGSYLGNSFMIVPIRLGQDVIGIINVAEKCTNADKTGTFDYIDLKILNAIATEMAVAIENVAFYKELHYLTVTDPLTHIHNYRHFVNSLVYELKRIKRYQGELSMLMMDIDGFKSYNDHLGHVEGDELLKKFSLTVHLNLREIDIFCRYGGDEFVVILPGTGKEEAVLVAEKIRKAVENASFQRPVTLSIGVVEYQEKMTRHDLIFNADKALYKAKNLGKNRVCVFGQD